MRKYILTVLLISLLIGTFSLTTLASPKEAAYNAARVAYALDEEHFTVYEDEINVGYLDKGESYRFSTTLYESLIYAIVGVGDNDARDVDIRVYDENFNEVAVDTETTMESLVFVAPRWTGTFYIKITMYDVKPYERGAYFCQFYAYKAN